MEVPDFTGSLSERMVKLNILLSGQKNITLIGSSFGGLMATIYAMEYTDAVDKVNELGGKMKYGEDFGADEEALLTKEIDKPMFVHKYPKDIKAFYMKEDPKNPELVLNNDLLAPRGHGEIVGGSERIWDHDELMARIKEQKLPVKDYQWYIDLRKYGSVPHSGFGLGIERFVKWILNLEHIRDTIPFPRTITRCYP